MIATAFPRSLTRSAPALRLTALLAILPHAIAQLAPNGERYAGRASDTGFGGNAVDATGSFPTSVALDLPPSRAGLPLPLQMVYGAHRVGAAGLGWDIPLSYLQQDSTFAHRRPASAANAPPVPRQRTTISLLGQNADLIPRGNQCACLRTGAGEREFVHLRFARTHPDDAAQNRFIQVIQEEETTDDPARTLEQFPRQR